jgi:hypothetical protein
MTSFAGIARLHQVAETPARHGMNKITVGDGDREIAKVPVLPVPDCACAMVSRPRMTGMMARRWNRWQTARGGG